MENVFEVEQDGMTAVLVQDKESKGYTAFYVEDPRGVAEGDTKEEALEELRKAHQVMLDWDKEENVN